MESRHLLGEYLHLFRARQLAGALAHVNVVIGTRSVSVRRLAVRALLALSVHDGEGRLDDAVGELGPEGDGRGAAVLVVEVDAVVPASFVALYEEVAAEVARHDRPLPTAAAVPSSDAVLVFPVGHHAHLAALVARRADILGQPRTLRF